MMLGDVKALLSFSLDPGVFSQPHAVCQTPTEGKGLQRRQLGRRRCTCPMDCPDSVWHLGQVVFLHPTAQSPACASSWLPPRLPQFFAELLVQHVAGENLGSLHCCAQSLPHVSLPEACNGPTDNPSQPPPYFFSSRHIRYSRWKAMQLSA